MRLLAEIHGGAATVLKSWREQNTSQRDPNQAPNWNILLAQVEVLLLEFKYVFDPR